jgi:hypothetical protein
MCTHQRSHACTLHPFTCECMCTHQRSHACTLHPFTCECMCTHQRSHACTLHPFTCAHINAAMHAHCTHSLVHTSTQPCMHTAPIHLCMLSHNLLLIASVRGPECVLPTLACMSYIRIPAHGQRHHRSVQPTNCSLLLGFLFVESMRASSFYANSWRMLTLTVLSAARAQLPKLKLPPAFARRELIITCTLEVQAAAAARQR